ncbi:MAG: phosphotransferase, partial [Pseudomonadota bacterium]|nr:phosphotransferase [Pseudomonadota bacterium]
MSTVIPVTAAHRFDEAKLIDYLRDAGLAGTDGAVSIGQFQGGQSNPTFLVTAGPKRYVLRKKPPGELLPSAHLVEREYRVMKALGPTGFPV